MSIQASNRSNNANNHEGAQPNPLSQVPSRVFTELLERVREQAAGILPTVLVEPTSPALKQSTLRIVDPQEIDETKIHH